MAIRAFWQHHNRHNEVDRIEVHDAEWADPEFELCGDSTGFSFQHDEITSESNEKLINIQANRVQIGKLDFRPRIESTAGETLLADIRDSDNKRFHIEWYKDGVFEWAGWITTRIFSYPEKSTAFFAQIRATDFEILKGEDYPLSDTRQTFITTLSDLFSELPVATPIRTATSWVEENVTAAVGSTTYDFLNEIYHETKALRDFARTGDETDQPITKWEALEHVAEPALLIRQMNGHIYIDQITELADPAAVNETTYDSTGTETTPTANVDRRQTGYTSVSSGTPAVKVTSQNDTYPAIKRAKNKFAHRAIASSIKFPSIVEPNTSFSQTFSSDGNQEIWFSTFVNAIVDTTSAQCRITLQAGSYWWDDTANEWVDVNDEPVQSNIYDLTVTSDFAGENPALGVISIETSTVPSDADGNLSVTFGTISSFVSGGYRDSELQIVNDITEKNSTSINYQLTQTNPLSQIIEIEDTWFGDGPYNVPSALHYSSNSLDLTNDSWQRRGSTAYRNYHENLLKEVLDMGRTNMRKLQADIWGSYDPSKVLDYNGSYFFYAGGKYDGVTGKWQVTLMELDLVEDGTDNFEDIPKFTDETGSGSGSTSTGGGGGGLDQGTADARYFRQANNLSEGDPATIRSNIDVYSTTEAHNQFLDEALNLSDLTNITDAQDNLGLTDGSADLRFNTLQVDGALTLEGNVAFNADGALFSYNTDGTGRGLWDATASGVQMWQVRLTGSNNLNFDRRDAGAGELQSDGNTIWHAGNDGPGSGLNADLWDGNQFADYLDQPVRTTDGVQFNMVTVDATSGIPFEIRESGTFRAALNYGYSLNSLLLETANSTDTRTERIRIAGEQDATQIGLGTTSFEGFGLNVDLASQFRQQTEFQDRVIFEDAYSASFNAHVSINNTMQGENALLTLGSIDSAGTSRTGGVGFNPDLNTVFLRNGPDSRFEMFANGDLVSDGSLDFQDSDGLLGHNIENLNELNVRDISSNRGGSPIEILDGINVAGNSTFNSRLTVADGNLVLHENGYSYYDVVGQNFTFNTDSSTRTFLSISRGAVGDTGTTNRLWGLQIKASDDIVFNPDTGGGVDFPSEISNNNQSFTTGFSGNGWKQYEEASEWYFETDVGFFRSALFANEFIINQILATQGSRIAGPGRGKIETIVDGTSGSEVVEVSDPEGNQYAAFAVDDLILCLQVRNDLDIGTTNVLTDSGGVIVKRYVRQVTDITGNQVTFSTPADAPSDAAGPAQGDVIVAFGNTTDVNRQNILYETVIEPNAPYTVLKTEIDSWTAYKASGNLQMKYGNLNQSYGYTSDTYGLAVGPPSGDHATFDPTNGVRFVDGSGLVGAQFNSSVLTLGTGSNFVEFDVSAGSGNIELDTFNLESTNIRVSDINTGFIRVGAGGSNDQGGLTGQGTAGSIGFWMGDGFGNISIAPIRMHRNGDFHFGGSGSDFIESSSGTLTADFDDISFSSNTFDLSANGLSITTADGIDVGSDFWHNDNTFSFGGGILNGDGSSVNLAGFTATSDLLSRTAGTLQVSLGTGSTPASDVTGFVTGTDTDNRLFAAVLGNDTDYEFQVRVGGDDIVQLGSRVNVISGFSLTSTEFQSTNNTGYETSGIYMDSAGERISVGSIFSANGATDTGSLADWDVLTTAIRKNDIDINSAVGAIRVGYGSSLQAGLNSSSNSGDTAIWAGETWSNRGVADFRVTYGGVLNATGATIEGHIEGNTGFFHGDLDVGNVLSADASANTGRFASAYFDETDLWGGASSKSNATIRLNFADGTILYDAMGKTVLSGTNRAGLSSGDTVSPVGDSEYETEAPSGAGSVQETKVSTSYEKRFGVPELLITVTGRLSGDAGNIIVEVTNLSGTVQASTSFSLSGTTTRFSRHNLDISGIADGTGLIVNVILEANSSSTTTNAFMEDDIVIVENTG